MVMDPTLRQAYAEQAGLLHQPPPAVSTVSLTSPPTTVPDYQHLQYPQNHTLIPQGSTMAAPATTVLPSTHHRTPVAYKRPLQQSSSSSSGRTKMLGTPTVSLSPRATPPSKVLITHQRMMSHMGPPLPPLDIHDASQQPLTPPPTPEGLNHI